MSAGGAAGGFAAGGAASPGKGLVLVFDLDNTIINSSEELIIFVNDKTKSPEEKTQLIDQALNKELIRQVLKPAADIRNTSTNKVDAIFLLTNNSSYEYVSAVCTYLAKILKSKGSFETVRADRRSGDPGFPAPTSDGYFFDYIMVRQHPSRSLFKLTKSSQDITFMMNSLKKPINDLLNRVLFFDDAVPKHYLFSEFEKEGLENRYIFIKNNTDQAYGFVKGTNDITDYSFVTSEFRRVMGLNSMRAARESKEGNEGESKESKEGNENEGEGKESEGKEGEGESEGKEGEGESKKAEIINSIAANKRVGAYFGGRRRYKKTKRRYKKAKANKKTRRR